VVLVSVACAFEPNAVAPSLVACAHKPEAVASTPLTLLQVAATTVLIVVPLVPRVCTVPLLLAPPIVVPPSVAPLAVAFLDASTSEVSDVDSEFVPVVIPCRPVESEITVFSPVDKDDKPVDNEEIPVDVEVDKEFTLPLVVDKPVDNELTFDALLDSPVDRELTVLLVLDKPVDKEPKPVEVDVDNEFTLLLTDDRPDDVAVDSEFSWLTLTASVFCVPAATLMI